MCLRIISRFGIPLITCCALLLSACSKTGTGGDVAVDDGTAPTTISDLRIAAFTDASVTLTWTASGDDSTVGTAAAYELRTSTEYIHWGNFDSALEIAGLPNPKPSGESEQFEVRGLKTDSTYYFALRVFDENNNYNGVSNCVHATCFNDFVVSIPDANLLAAIRSQINKPSGSILKSDMLKLVDLFAADLSISQITGLQYATNLKSLNLVNNSVSNLMPLEGLSQLEQFSANQNAISDLAPISGLTNLTSLGLRNNAIEDIDPLAGLTKLTAVDLQDNDLKSVDAIQSLTLLSSLNLSENHIRDISPLISNDGLGSGDNIVLYQNPLEHESIMSHIPTLRSRGATVGWTDNTAAPAAVTDLAVDTVTATSVTLSWSAPGEDYNQGTAYQYEVRYSKAQADLQSWTGGIVVPNPPDPDTAGTTQSVVVSGLEQDTTYYFALRTQDNSENWSETSNIAWGSPYQDVVVTFPDAALEAEIRAALNKPSGDIYRSELKNIDTLIADSKGISDLTGLEYCVNLRYLHLISNDITHIDQLAGLMSLYELNLQDNNIADISPIASLTNLFVLQISVNPIGTFEDLSSLTNLWFLSATFVGASDLHPLQSLIHLQYLFIMGNSISDISPLSYLTHLTGLYLDVNAIQDISVLSGLSELNQISLKYNSIQDISPLISNAGLISGDAVYLDNNPLSDESINTYIPALQARGVTVTF